MELSWYGHSCFRITERGQITVVTDPYSGALGLPPLKVKGDVVTISHDAPGHNAVDAIQSPHYSLTGPGEYELGGVFITGLALHDTQQEPPHRNIAYLINYDKLSVLHLGDLTYVPDQSVIEDMGNVDVLLIPVGGGNGLRASQAADVVSLIEPRYVVPMHYALPGLAVELEPVEKFLKAMGVSHAPEEETLKVSAGELTDQPQVMLLTPQI